MEGPYGMWPSNDEAVKRWSAERENASARLELAKARQCCYLLLSQHNPLHSLRIDREQLRILLDFIWHCDPERLRRELGELGDHGNP